MINHESPSALSLETFPTTTVASTTGTLTVPCEPVTDGLAITPCLDLGEDSPRLGGGFSITHTPSGRLVVRGQACLECAREVGQRLAATGVRWTELNLADPQAFRADVSVDGVDQHQAVIAALRLFQKCQQAMCFIDGDDEPCGACGMVRQHAHYCMHVVVPMVAELNTKAAEAVAAR